MAVLLLAPLAVVGVPAPATAATGPVPGGYRVTLEESLEPGLDHVVLRGDGAAQEVHVARLAPALRTRLRTVLAGDTLGAGLERTSSMCARTDCVLAVNGDFTDPSGYPVGAMVSRRELVASPGIPHAYFSLTASGEPSARLDFGWRADVRTADGMAFPVDSVNREQLDERVTLYTSRWGASTRSDPSSVELVVELAGARRPVLPGGDTPVRLVALRPGGNAPIAPGQVVLSGRGRGAVVLDALWERRAALGDEAGTLSVSTGDAAETMGGSPRLLSGGRYAFPTGNRDAFTQGANPRTMAGFTASGEVLLVTVDGRQPGYSTGLSLVDAANLLVGLGAVEAVNLDGGGSSTFVTGGQVRNRPSDAGGERPVTSALVLVPADQVAAAPAPAPPSAITDATPVPSAIDPASRPPNLVKALADGLAESLEPARELLAPVEALVDDLLGSLLGPRLGTQRR